MRQEKNIRKKLKKERKQKTRKTGSNKGRKQENGNRK